MTPDETGVSPDTIRDIVRSRYAESARRITLQPTSACCASCSPQVTHGHDDPITSNLYDANELAGLPDAAVLASLGCGNPTALAELHPGEIVLDLGSGGGIDVLLSARRVGPTGFAYGLDMTDEMLELAEANRQAARIDNVRFLKGHIEQIPLPDNAVDVIISNCVINLSADKPRVLREAFRVLKPGGRLAVSDVVVQGELPANVRTSMEAWVGCVAGALEENEYHRYLAEAGFSDIGIEVTRVYDPVALAAAYAGTETCCGAAPESWDPAAFERFATVGGRLVSAFIRARKPSVGAGSKPAPTKFNVNAGRSRPAPAP